MLVLPIGNGLLYVEPVDLQSKSNDLPTLVRVVVTDGRRFLMEQDLGDAIRRLVSGAAAVPVPAVVKPEGLGAGTKP
jgi:uncharacterized membrane protein (UPF0182 family)